jgi:LPS-assembly lipoprotein
MWSSEPRLARRRLGFAALAVLPLLAGCNLRPIYGRVQQEGVRPELAAIEIVELSGRRGQLFRNYLIDELNPGGLVVPAAYALEVRLRQEQTALGIQLDDTATRYNLVLGADFALKRKVDDQVIYSSATRRVVSFNVRSDPFGTLVAEQDAERRASREVARQIRTMLSLYFADQTA